MSEAIQAMPAAKVLGKAFYPAEINPQYNDNNTIIGLDILWKRTPVFGQ